MSDTTPENAGREIARKIGEGIRLDLSGSTGDLWIRAIRNAIRAKGTRPEPPARWVLVRQHRDGVLKAVYGPYAKDHADWLLGVICGPPDSWAVIELQKEPEP